MITRQDQDDPTFCSRIRLLRNLIKAVHHLHNITTGVPPALQRLKQHLATVIKLAIPCAETLSLIWANAENWAYTTAVILRDHYENLITEIKLSTFGETEANILAPFEVAIKWAKKNLGRWLLQITTDWVQQILRDCLLNSPLPSPLIPTQSPATDTRLPTIPSPLPGCSTDFPALAPPERAGPLPPQPQRKPGRTRTRTGGDKGGGSGTYIQIQPAAQASTHLEVATMTEPQLLSQGQVKGETVHGTPAASQLGAASQDSPITAIHMPTDLLGDMIDMTFLAVSDFMRTYTKRDKAWIKCTSRLLMGPTVHDGVRKGHQTMSHMEDYNNASAMAAPGTHHQLHWKQDGSARGNCSGTIQSVCVYLCLCEIRNFKPDAKHKNDFRFHKWERGACLL